VELDCKANRTGFGSERKVERVREEKSQKGGPRGEEDGKKPANRNDRREKKNRLRVQRWGRRHAKFDLGGESIPGRRGNSRKRCRLTKKEDEACYSDLHIYKGPSHFGPGRGMINRKIRRGRRVGIPLEGTTFPDV